MRLKLALPVVFALLAAGCGSTRAVDAKKPPSAASRVSRNDIPGALASGWKTDFSRHSVRFAEIQSGGPGKDGIPALNRPRFAPASTIRFLTAREPVIELTVAGDARAYPLQILIWHEIANDRVGGVPVAVTFCPLCNTAIAFDRRVGRRTLSFGTTGNLRNSDLVMYDRQTESWWQQFGGEALVGHYTGTRLRQLPARIVAWSQFRREHPHGLVLTRQTGYSRSYGENPYVGYDDISSPPFFPAAHSRDRRLAPKERVVFIERGSDAIVVPFTTLAQRRTVEARVGGHELVVRWRGQVRSALDQAEIAIGREVGAAQVTERGQLVSFDEPFWFAVAAFRPHVRVVR